MVGVIAELLPNSFSKVATGLADFVHQAFGQLRALVVVLGNISAIVIVNPGGTGRPIAAYLNEVQTAATEDVLAHLGRPFASCRSNKSSLYFFATGRSPAMKRESNLTWQCRPASYCRSFSLRTNRGIYQ
ncbi:MAG: hypothetical protein R3B96_24635 [Pirellulaceae bacterium]